MRPDYDPQKLYELTIVKEGRQAFVVLPFDARKAFGQPKGTLFVTGTLNGAPYRGRLMSMGGGGQMLFVTGEMMRRAGCAVGDVVPVCFAPVDGEAAATAPPLVARSGMDTLAAITGRASVRRYTSQPVEQKLLDTVLNAGFCAPSASAKRPWHFVVVRRGETLAALAAGSPFARLLASAPVAVVVCGDRMRQGTEELLHEDCAAAAQNMLLAAHALGLGAVWCGVRRRSEFEKLIAETLRLPHKVLPVAVLAMGWPGEEKRQPERFVRERVHNEVW